MRLHFIKIVFLLNLLSGSNILYSQIFAPTPIGSYKKYEKGELDKAETDFKQILKKDTSLICLYGLANIYADDKFKSYNLENAYDLSDMIQSYIQGSEGLTWSSQMSKKELREVEKLNILPENIRNLKDEILIRIYNKTLIINTITGFKEFIDKYPSAPQVTEAWKNIHSLAFNDASIENTIDAYKNFISNYPNAIHIQETKTRIHSIAYSQATEKNTIEAFQDFVNSYSNATQVKDANDKICSLAYALAQETNTVEALENFMKTYPENPFKKQVWEKIYEIEYKYACSINTIDAFQNFINLYPNSKQVVEAIEKIHSTAYESSCKQNTIKVFEDFINQYPNAKQLTLAKEKIRQLLEFYSLYNDIENLKNYNHNIYILKNDPYKQQYIIFKKDYTCKLIINRCEYFTKVDDSYLVDNEIIKFNQESLKLKIINDEKLEILEGAENFTCGNLSNGDIFEKIEISFYHPTKEKLKLINYNYPDTWLGLPIDHIDRILDKNEIIIVIRKLKKDVYKGIEGNWVIVETLKNERGFMFDGYLKEI